MISQYFLRFKSNNTVHIFADRVEINEQYGEIHFYLGNQLSGTVFPHEKINPLAYVERVINGKNDEVIWGVRND